jgi:hypothetical protein
MASRLVQRVSYQAAIAGEGTTTLDVADGAETPSLLAAVTVNV